jgi:hypothetical protein
MTFSRKKVAQHCNQPYLMLPTMKKIRIDEKAVRSLAKPEKNRHRQGRFRYNVNNKKLT